MQFMLFPHLPVDHLRHDSPWVDFPNWFYDPVKGHELDQRYLRERVLAGEIGYDALVTSTIRPRTG